MDAPAGAGVRLRLPLFCWRQWLMFVWVVVRDAEAEADYQRDRDEERRRNAVKLCAKQPDDGDRSCYSREYVEDEHQKLKNVQKHQNSHGLNRTIQSRLCF